jgi:hypothetical protein
LNNSRKESPSWPVGIARLLEEARTDFNQLTGTGRIERADDLTIATAMMFDSSYNPMFFTGAFESQIVLIHLNPKLSPQLATYPYIDFVDYYERHRNFGLYHWGMIPSYKAPFDMKQVRFLRPFDTIAFRPDTGEGHARANAAMAIDSKLQLELIPYASQTFETAKFPIEILEPHFARVLGAISAYPRKYVLFCGAVFDDLIQGSGLLVSRNEHRFRVETKKGPSKVEYRFSNVEFELGGMRIKAGVARSFATQGLPMDAYGYACSRLYGID